MTFKIIEAKDFNLAATLESGQVFGFTKEAGGVYFGAIDSVETRLTQRNGSLHAETSSRKMPDLENYFDLAHDLTPIYQVIFKDEAFGKAVQSIRGLRIIRQDSWEALACFIISSNNNVKRIQGIWRNLRKLSTTKNSFPQASEIARSHENILRELGLGYRAPYLLRSAQFVAANPESLQMIRAADYEEAKERLLAFPGIGEKVADCVLLYGFQNTRHFRLMSGF